MTFETYYTKIIVTMYISKLLIITVAIITSSREEEAIEVVPRPTALPEVYFQRYAKKELT